MSSYSSGSFRERLPSAVGRKSCLKLCIVYLGLHLCYLALYAVVDNIYNNICADNRKNAYESRRTKSDEEGVKTLAFLCRCGIKKVDMLKFLVYLIECADSVCVYGKLKVSS